MENMKLSLGCIIHKDLMVMIVTIVCSMQVGEVIPMDPSQQFTAMFSFGDSLTDSGNNNYLNSLAKANYVPYGIDLAEGPSGRFCNGRTPIDYICDLVGIPTLPAYANSFSSGRNIMKGVNYASAAGGILEETGQNLGERFSLSQQVQNFENTMDQLRSQMEDGELTNYLAKALAVMTLGSNDYINNYLQPTFYTTSYFYNPKDFADLLINRYSRQILALHSLGLKKFLLGGVGPLGCIPNQLANDPSQHGKCVASTNEVAGMFNDRLVSLVDELNNKYNNGSIFAYGNIFGTFMDILNNSKAYGFNVTDRGCCGIGRNQGQITCLPLSIPCNNRNQYVFWDAFHPTQAVNQILAQRAYTGSTSECYPVNLKQMALM